MEAASDHGLIEGFVIPFHFIDRLGRMDSASGVLCWTDRRSAFQRLPRLVRAELPPLMTYVMQQSLEIRARGGSAIDRADPRYEAQWTDRGRSILEWAGRGKMSSETADLLGISVETVNTHVATGIRKLDAANRTQAIVKGVEAGLIDP